MAAVFVELWGEDIQKTLIDFVRTIKNNLEASNFIPSNEELTVLYDLVLHYLQKIRNNESQNTSTTDLLGPSLGPNLASKKSDFVEALLMQICEVCIHILALQDVKGGLNFNVIIKNVLLCVTVQGKCAKFVNKFCIKNINDYIKALRDGVSLNDVEEPKESKEFIVGFHFALPISSTLQLLLAITNERFQNSNAIQENTGATSNESHLNELDDNGIFDALLTIMHSDAEDAILAITSQIMRYYLKSEFNKGKLWDRIVLLSEDDIESEVAYGMACLVIDDFLCGTGSDIRFKLNLRAFIQCGLIKDDTLTRKRTMYILKRILDASSIINAKIGVLGPFVLLFETLEEKQLHVMLPILSTIQDVIKLSISQKDGDEPLHITWLTTALTRALKHDCKYITRWAIETSLRLEVDKLQFFGEENWGYICGPLFNALKEIHLYEKESDMNERSSPTIVNQLREFFAKCKTAAACHDQEIPFFRKILQSLCSSGFNTLTFPYIADSLSSIEIPGVVDAALLSEIKTWMLGDTTAFPTELKTAAYHLMLTIVMNCLDFETVSLIDVVKFVKVISERGYLIYGSSMWRKISCMIIRSLPSWCLSLSSENITDDADMNVNVDESRLPPIRLIIDKFLIEESKLADSSEEVTLLLFLGIDQISKEHHEHASQKVSNIIDPLLTKLGKVGRNPYVMSEETKRCVLLTRGIIEKVGEALQLRTKQDISRPILEMILNILLEQSDSCLAMFRTTLTSCLYDNDIDMPVVVACLELQISICGYFNEPSVRKGPMFAAFIHHLELLCEICCNNAIKKIQATNFIGLNLIFQAIKMLCDFVIGDFCESEKQILENIVAALVKLSRGISIKFESYLPSNYFKEQSNRKERSKERDSFLEVGDFTLALWSLLCFGIRRSDIVFGICSSLNHAKSQLNDQSLITLATCDVYQLVKVILNTIDVSVGKDIVPLLKCLGILMPQVHESSPDLAHLALDATWRVLMEQERRDNVFWCIYGPAIDVLFNKALLFCRDTKVVEKLQGFWSKLENLGLTKTGMFNVLVNHCCALWGYAIAIKTSDDSMKEERKMALESMYLYVSQLVDASIFGQVQKKSSRILQQAIEHFKTSFPGNNPISNNTNIDYQVRWCVVSLLLQLNPELEDTELAGEFMKGLVDKDRQITERFRRYYDNSLTHRQKLRIWQIMVVLMKFIDHRNAEEILRDAMSVMVCENQPSIRYYQEWFVILVVNKFPFLRSMIWDRLKEASEKRVFSITSLMSIITHLTVLLPNQEFTEMAAEAFGRLLPWIQIHHMQARVHAQIVIRKLWNEAKERNSVVILKEFGIIESLFSLNESNASVFKATNEIKDHFYFKIFHPLNHFSLESIFVSMPKLLSIGDDEILNERQFSAVSSGQQFSNGMKVFDKDPSLFKVVTSCNVIEMTNAGVQVRNAGNKTTESEKRASESSVDVQKKITAWKPLPPTEDPFLQKAELYKKEMKRSELILCASLIDRTPNLGGLCRTCEIFGVSTFVIGAMRYLDDSNFKSLSVTSEKWVNIEQVLARHLEGYLSDMKRKGYRLVGIEQTANSKPLQSYEFNDKTLLLLGNEKEGIPVNLIQLLDDCVEIPQQGVIRSLNVHVSGAIIIWEYCKQRLLNLNKG